LIGEKNGFSVAHIQADPCSANGFYFGLPKLAREAILRTAMGFAFLSRDGENRLNKFSADDSYHDR